MWSRSKPERLDRAWRESASIASKEPESHGESSLRRALQQYLVHYHEERNHQGRDNRILFPLRLETGRKMGAVRCRERLAGLLKYYEREAA